MEHGSYKFEQRIGQLKRRLFREATTAIEMLERSLDALWRMDADLAAATRQRDDRVDSEEVEIEQQCYELMTLGQPVAGDFRSLAFVLKVNADLERVADHAVSIAKVVPCLDGRSRARWPTALGELRERVPMMCHALMRAVLDEDADAARALVSSDKIIDRLDRRLFDEVAEMMRHDPELIEDGMLLYRVSRELERVGDLMANIAEDVVYLVTGEIVRHAKRRPPRATGS